MQVLKRSITTPKEKPQPKTFADTVGLVLTKQVRSLKKGKKEGGAGISAAQSLRSTHSGGDFSHLGAHEGSPMLPPSPSRSPSAGEPTLRASLVALFSPKLNLLLVFCVLGPVAGVLKWGDTFAFTFNFLAILPLAQMLGNCTEEVALRVGEVIGGLLNATLGNATELIISVLAIQKGMLRVTQVSLLGSILSNELLVLGFCFFCGGLIHSEQHFSAKAASINSSLLILLILGLSIPAAYTAVVKSTSVTPSGFLCNRPCEVANLEDISHITALLLFSIYWMMLYFQLKTHKSLMEGKESPPSPRVSPAPQQPGYIGDLLRATEAMEAEQAAAAAAEQQEEEEEDEAPEVSLTVAVAGLVISTLLVALCSEFLVDAIEGVANAWNLSELFIGLILLPIVGNAAEHMTAVTVAMKGKMDLALGVALGSSIQIGLCVIPAVTIAGWAAGQPLTLDFHPFETIVLVMAVLVVTCTLSDGNSTWLEGAMLLVSYIIIAVVYLYREDPPEPAGGCICGMECCAMAIPTLP